MGNKSRRSTAEVAGIKAGSSQIADLTQPYSTADGKSGYLPALNNTQDKIKAGIANAYGAAGQLDNVPDQYKFGADGKPRVNQTYLPGGPLYAGNGGAWASQPPPRQQSQGAGAQPATISGPGDIAKLPHGQPFIIPSGPNQGKIGYAQQ